MVKLTKRYWKNVTCMAIQDYIKYKRNEIIKYNGLYDALKNAKIDHDIENIASGLISQSTEQERKLRAIARHIGCK